MKYDPPLLDLVCKVVIVTESALNLIDCLPILKNQVIWCCRACALFGAPLAVCDLFCDAHTCSFTLSVAQVAVSLMCLDPCSGRREYMIMILLCKQVCECNSTSLDPALTDF